MADIGGTTTDIGLLLDGFPREASMTVDVGAVNDAGAVNVLYGSGSGLTAVGDQLWHQDSPGILGGAEAGDYFGHSLASR